MARILVLPYTHTLSHISRVLAIACKLRAKGHDVIFGGKGRKTAFIETKGFPVFSIYEPNPEQLFENIRKGKLRFIEESELMEMIEADLSLYRKVKPDIVLTDGRLSAQISTQIARLPHVAVVNVSSTKYRALPYVPLFEWIPESIIGRHLALWRLIELLNLKLEMVVFNNLMNVFKKFSRKYGIKKTVTATNCLEGKDITLLTDIPEYFPVRHLPPGYHYVGPITWESNIGYPKWWPPKIKNNLIYVTMGTTGLAEFFEIAYDLFKKSQYTCVITTGGQAESVPNIPGQLYVEKYVDGDLIISASDVVICHGGNGTIYQALRHGKPIIGIPTIPDQKFNMRRVEALGVGKLLSWEDFCNRPDILLNAVDFIINSPSYATNAIRMQYVLKEYNGPQLAAEIVEKWITSKKNQD